MFFSWFFSSGGIRPGDVITKINGKIVMSASDFYTAVENNDMVHLHIMRGQKKIELSIHPEELDS